MEAENAEIFAVLLTVSKIILSEMIFRFAVVLTGIVSSEWVPSSKNSKDSKLKESTNFELKTES